MKGNKLNSGELEDFEDALMLFEKQYGIYFSQVEINEIYDMKILADVILKKFQFPYLDDCTSQQAFYKVRKALIEINPKLQDLTPKTNLEIIIPRKNRRKKIKLLEEKMGFSLNILHPPDIFVIILSILSIATVVLAFFNIFFSFILGIIIFFIYQLVFHFAKEFREKTLGDMTNSIIRLNYFKLRSDPKTLNAKEFKDVILHWFADKMDIQEDKLANATFI